MRVRPLSSTWDATSSHDWLGIFSPCYRLVFTRGSLSVEPLTRRPSVLAALAARDVHLVLGDGLADQVEQLEHGQPVADDRLVHQRSQPLDALALRPLDG